MSTEATDLIEIAESPVGRKWWLRVFEGGGGYILVNDTPSGWNACQPFEKGDHEWAASECLSNLKWRLA